MVVPRKLLKTTPTNRLQPAEHTQTIPPTYTLKYKKFPCTNKPSPQTRLRLTVKRRPDKAFLMAYKNALAGGVKITIEKCALRQVEPNPAIQDVHKKQ